MIINLDNQREIYIIKSGFVDISFTYRKQDGDNMVESELGNLLKNRPEDSQIKIPEPLIYEVDKIVTQTGLYSDKIEFVTDAVRRLIIESRKEEVNPVFHNKNVHAKSTIKIKDVESKKTQKKTQNGTTQA